MLFEARTLNTKLKNNDFVKEKSSEAYEDEDIKIEPSDQAKINV